MATARTITDENGTVPEVEYKIPLKQTSVFSVVCFRGIIYFASEVVESIKFLKKIH